MTRRRPRRPGAALLAAAALALGGCAAPVAGPGIIATTASAGLQSPPSSAASSTGSRAATAIAPREEWIAYQWVAPHGDGIFLARPDGSAVHQILSDLPGSQYHPDWSADGSRLAFESVGDGDPAPISVWVAAPDGSGARQVAACPGSPCQQLQWPAFSPDGSTIAVVRYDLDASKAWGRTYLEVVDVASGRERIVASTADSSSSYGQPRWSPDGRWLAFEYTTSDAAQTVGTGSAIAVVAAGGPADQTPRLVTKLTGFGGYPDWSKDGTLILFGTFGIEDFEEGGPGASNLWTVHPDGTGLTELTRNTVGGTRVGHPSWTPDGRRIMLTTIEGSGMGDRHTAVMDADGSNLTVLSGFSSTHSRLRPT